MVAAGVAAAIGVASYLVVREVLGGDVSGERLRKVAQEALGSSALAWTAILATQFALLACAWLACRLLGKPPRERLGLLPTSLRPVHWTVVLISTVVPFAIGLCAAWLVSGPANRTSQDAYGLQRMWGEGSRGGSVAWILLIAILPALAEETFYRGLIQRGLLVRWGPAASIVTSSLLFAIVHADPASAAAIFPLGLWLGVVAWRTGSVVLPIAMHACVNGLWTAGMMILHRDPASEPLLNWIALGLLGLGHIAFPWALMVLRRVPAIAPGDGQPRPVRLLMRVAVVAVPAGLIFFVLVPPGASPVTPTPAGARPAPAIADLEAGAVEAVTCRAVGEEGAVEFGLVPGRGVRMTLPENQAGIDHIIVALDAHREVVWLAYAGEMSGKGTHRRPIGIVEQLASGAPTVLCMRLSEGPPPVTVRATLEEDEARIAAVTQEAQAEGWARRGRK